MDNQYSTLLTLAGIAQETTNPVQYQCTPREMILHSTFDWDLIHSHLLRLAEYGFVVVTLADSIQFSITQKGLDEADKLLEEDKALKLRIANQLS